MPADLAAFLAARLDEAGRNAGEIHTRDCHAMSPVVTWGSPSQGWGPCNCGQPERDLRAITAKRAILADCTAKLRYPANRPLYNLAVRTLGNLAAEWDDHPAYQPEWKP